MAIDKDKWAAEMNEGEHVRPAAILLPIISLDGNTGIFKRKNVGENGYEKAEEIGQTFSGVIIAIRMQLSEFGKKVQRSSMEYDKSTDQVTIFERHGKGDKGKKTFSGYAMSAKNAYPELREQRWLYMIVQGALVKVQIKGGSMGYWFKFLQELSKKKLHTFQVVAKFDPNPEHNEELGKDYFAAVPQIMRELTDAELEEKIKPEFEALQARLQQQRQFQSRPRPVEHVDGPALDDVPIINLEDDEPADEEPEPSDY
jgi:hypothetical protein